MVKTTIFSAFSGISVCITTLTVDKTKKVCYSILIKEDEFCSAQSSSNYSMKSTDYLTEKDVCLYLNCSRDTLYRYRKEGKIAYIKLKRKVLYPKDKLLLFLGDHLQTGLNKKLEIDFEWR